MTPWPHQQRGRDETIAAIEAGETAICLTSPTGGGKTWLMLALIWWALSKGWQVVLYTNRKMLFEQTARVLEADGVEFGKRASGHKPALLKDVQISTIQTEWQRCYKAKTWELHEAQLVLVDEAHTQKKDTAQRIFQDHQAAGAVVVGVTATPLDIGHIYRKLIVAGTTSELRRCGALVPCHTYGPTEPDCRKIEKRASGTLSEQEQSEAMMLDGTRVLAREEKEQTERTEAEEAKVVMLQVVFGHIYEWWEKLNPDQRPTLLFAPGVPESVWCAKEFERRGVRAAHVDGDHVYIDHKTYRSNANRRALVMRDSESGAVPVICNRFVMREGIDAPWLYHGILATPFGNLQSYLQAGGRLLRNAEALDEVVIQDHGGNWWRHGSLNDDRQWSLEYTNRVLAALRGEQIREKKEPEPIICVRCKRPYRFDYRNPREECPNCGYRLRKRCRPVLEEDGQLHEYGSPFPPRRRKAIPNVKQIWERMYHRAKNSKKGMTFLQAEALFAIENHWHYPPRDLPLMPISSIDWCRKVKDVPKESLTTQRETASPLTLQDVCQGPTPP